jgi:hypothetical protein
MDVHVRSQVTDGLRLREVGVLTSQEHGTTRFEDADLLDRATTLGRVRFSQDEDLLAEAPSRQQAGATFAGVIYAHQRRVTIGQCIEDLEFLALAGEPDDFAGKVEYLPLKSPSADPGATDSSRSSADWSYPDRRTA